MPSPLVSLRSIFRCVHKIAKNYLVSSHLSFCLSVHVSIQVEQLSSYWTECRGIWYLRIFRKSDKNNGYFMWRPIYIFQIISLNSSHIKKCFRQTCRENQNTHFLFNKLFYENSSIYEVMWKCVVEPDRPQKMI